MAGHIYNPPRNKSIDALKADLRVAREHGGRAGLIGPSLTDYPHAEEALAVEGVDFSITSLRASPKSAKLVALLKSKGSVSIAPEAGTDRLRRVINKRISEDDILETSGLLLNSGIRKLRLYFMVGLPTEQHEDIEGIVELVEKVRAVSKKGLINITLSAFVPKPATPFQWHPMLALKEIKGRLGYLRKELRHIKGVTVSHDVPRQAYMQAVLARGDRRLSAVLVKMSRGQNWQTACREAGVDPAFYALRQRERDEMLPWDFIEHDVDKNALWEKYAKLTGM